MTAKQTYLRALRCQPSAWIADSAANPSKYMRPIHIALHLIELRRRKRIASYYDAVSKEEGWA